MRGRGYLWQKVVESWEVVGKRIDERSEQCDDAVAETGSRGADGDRQEDCGGDGQEKQKAEEPGSKFLVSRTRKRSSIDNSFHLANDGQCENNCQ
ncbi:hypothetical protein JCM7447_01240 [Corynebacterium amycolatum]